VYTFVFAIRYLRLLNMMRQCHEKIVNTQKKPCCKQNLRTDWLPHKYKHLIVLQALIPQTEYTLTFVVHKEMNSFFKFVLQTTYEFDEQKKAKTKLISSLVNQRDC